MCIIIDANFAADLFADPKNADNAPVISWLFDKGKDGIMVYGGKLAEELFIIRQAHRSIRTLAQAGRAMAISDKEVNTQQGKVLAMNICQSDDPHIIALAQISGARTLCSHDGALHGDFKNKALIDGPRGSIYQNEKHSRLLKHTPSCIKPRKPLK
jgi:hypothetical protein